MKRLGVAAVVLVLLLGACSSGGTSSPTSSRVPVSGSSDASSSGASSSSGSGSSSGGPATTVPAPLTDQTPPTSINGITVDGPTIWVASIKSDQVLQVDRRTGAILRRIPTQGAGPDDIAIGPDGAVYTAGFTNGDVGRIVGGQYQVVTHISGGAPNPIEFTADGDLYVGTYGPHGILYRVPLDDAPAVKVASDLPDINAPGRAAGNTLLAPAGGLSGPGSVVRIDPKTGAITTVVSGLPPLLAGTTDSHGRFFALANLTGEVFAVDPATHTTKVVHPSLPGAPFDNLAFADDGTLYVSSFTKPAITVVTPGGAQSTLTIGKA